MGRSGRGRRHGSSKNCAFDNRTTRGWAFGSLEEFAVRRRIPRVLSVTDSQRAFDGLVQGLFDHRFEVRFQSGRALAQIQDRATAINADHSLITQAVLRELSVEKEV